MKSLEEDLLLIKEPQEEEGYLNPIGKPLIQINVLECLQVRSFIIIVTFKKYF